MQRFSKKRQSILECLENTKTHPNAEWIYNKLKKQYPDLSLATVYRNLIQLKNEGLICSLGEVNGKERFDATLTPHAHAVCIKCGKVIDLEDIPLPESDGKNIEKTTGFKIMSSRFELSGLCQKCFREENKH